jgi:hypothetical protein
MAKASRPTPATELVPVQSIIPEPQPGDGAITILPDGSFRMVLRVGSVNFDMTSRYERAAIVQNFGALIESLDLDMPLQIVSIPKQLDTKNYSRQFYATINDQRAVPTRRVLARAHVEFFDQQVVQQNILQRNLYVVVPYKGMSGPVTESFSDQMPFMGIIGALAPQVKKKLTKYTPSFDEIQMARGELDDRVAMIESGLSAIGIRVIQRLDMSELMSLLYESFHPGLAERQRHTGGDDFFGGNSPGQLPSGPSPRRPDSDDDDFSDGTGVPRRRRPGGGNGGAIAELPAGSSEPYDNFGGEW